MPSRKPTILGTGLSGLVGSTITKHLADKYEFTNLDITAGIDILKPTQIDHVFSSSSAGSVIHLAAFTDVNQANEQKDDQSALCYKLNVIGTKNIATACAKHHKHLVHISTDFVFDGTQTTPYTETDQPHPIEWYGQTKYLAEQEVTKANPNSVIMRIAYPYGGNHPERKDLVQKIIEKLTNNSLPPQFTDNLITPTYIPDIATAIDYFITHQTTGLYHTVGSTTLSSYDLAVKVAKAIGQAPDQIQKSSVIEYNQSASRPFQVNLSLSNQKYATESKHTPLDINAGLKQLLS